MEVHLVDHTGDAESRIAKYAAICYNSKTDEEANERRIRHLLKLGHLATLRFAYATFFIGGISRACANQLVRSKHLEYLQESQRYVKMTNASFVYPNTDKAYLISSAYQTALAKYEELIANGVKKEDARLVLPLGVCTNMYVTGNFQAWKDFIRLRMDKAAQWEIREVATEINEQLNSIAPHVFPINGET